MTRFFMVLALTSALAAGTLGAQDVPGKKQDQDPAKGKQDKKKQGEKGDEDGRIDVKELVARVAKNMQTSEDKLGKKDVTDPTRQIQRDIVSDLDKLIEQSQNQDKNKGEGGGGGGKDQPQDQKDKKQGEQENNQGGQGKAKAESKPGEGQQPQGQSKDAANKPMDGSGKPQPGGDKGKAEAKPDEGMGQDKHGEAKKPMEPGGKDQLAQAKPDPEEKKNDDKAAQGGDKNDPKDMKDQPKTVSDMQFSPWGNLPQADRMKMDAYARDRFMPQYEDLLRQYYNAIAEKNKRANE